MAKESDNSRYLRSTISNLAFLATICYVVHQKAISESSLVTIVMMFLGGYFGVRAYQHRTEVDIAASQSNPRFPIPAAYRYPPPPPPQDPPDPPAPPPPNVHETKTRPAMERPLVPRTDDSGGVERDKGRFRRWLVSLLQSGVAPVTIVLICGVVWMILHLALGTVTGIVEMKAAFAR